MKNLNQDYYGTYMKGCNGLSLFLMGQLYLCEELRMGSLTCFQVAPS